MVRQLGKGGLIGFLLPMVLFLGVQIVSAQDFPTKPVTLIVPMGVGGSHDLTGRALSSVARDYLGQPLIIQLKPGGGGAIGSDLVARATPDGYTLLFGGQHNSGPPAIEGRSKGPDDLAAVCRINYSPPIVVARADAPYKSFKEMLEWAKGNPGKLVFANTGTWGLMDISWKQIMMHTGITTKMLPYDGGGSALLAVIGGHADVNIGLSTTLLPHINSGKLRALAVLDQQRIAGLPDIPTAKEEGVNVVNLLWRGVLAPKGTPRPIIDKLALDFKRMTEDKSFITMIKQFGDDIQYLGPDELAKVWREEYETHKEIGKLFKK